MHTPEHCLYCKPAEGNYLPRALMASLGAGCYGAKGFGAEVLTGPSYVVALRFDGYVDVRYDNVFVVTYPLLQEVETWW